MSLPAGSASYGRLSPSAEAAAPSPEAETGPENYDIRGSSSKNAQLKLEQRRQKMSQEGRRRKANRGQLSKVARQGLGPAADGLRIKESDYMAAPEVVGVGLGRRMLTGRSGEPREKVVRGFLAANEDLYGLSAKQVARLRKRAEYTNPAGNLSWVSLEQSFNGVPVFQGELVAALTPEGELAQTSGTLTPGVDEKELDTTPGITAQAAVAAAAESLGLTVNPDALALKESSDDRSFVFSGGPFADDTKVELVYFPLDSGLVALAWSMVLWQDSAAFYTVVDAEDGALFFRKNIANDQTQAATYHVYGGDSPAPLSPGMNLLSAAVPVDQGAAVGRDAFTLVTQHPLGDPWLNDGDNTTTGNNVDAGMDLLSPNGIDAGSRPTGSPFRVFNFAYDPAPGFVMPPGESPTLANYRAGEIVNMFYWTNRFHDITYALGFTESARNFQQNNFGRGGLGNDRVLAEGQDFSGTSNANFFTPPDGQPGRMQMYIFNGPNPDRSSGLDQEILIHELTHGLSNRLHGNGSGLNFAQGGGMGEGWGDFYARAILSTADEDLGGVYAAGGYSTLSITAPTAYNSNYYYGIRRFPYALKTTVGANGRPHNPLTFADVDASKINLTDGAFPRGPIGSNTAHQVHAVGEVWCVTLMEVRARLIALHGFAAGNQRTLQLVTDGMKLNPADPTILNARDSILAASAASGGTPAEERAIWEGFAARGMGFGATVSAANSSPITVTESFDIPNLQLGTVQIDADSCDSGGFADPGEEVELAVQLTNPLGAPALGATAEIVGGGSAVYGDIPGGGSATQNLSFTVPSAADCGDKITLSININSSLGPVTKTYVLQVGAPTTVGAPVSAGTGDVAIPLPDVSTTDIPINVTDTGFVGDVNVRLRLNHTFEGDLQIRLVAPDGTSVPLSTNRGGSGDNFGSGANSCSGTPTVFDDSAATAVSAGIAPFAGTFRPETPLSALNGKQMNGVWKIRIVDTGSADVGTLGCATLEITRQLYFCCGVPGTPIVEAVPPAAVVSESVSPANNAPDPDETVTMSFPLRNVGTGLSTNLVATLLPGGGVNAPSGPQSYGVLSPIGPAASRDYTFVPSGNCGDQITATFQLQDGPLDLGTVSFKIRLGSTAVGGASGANATNINIPGTGTGAATGAPASPYPSAINISGVTGTVSKVTATLTGFSHTFPSDVDVLLVGPGGQKVVLLSDMGSSTDAVNANITFDDSAPAVGAVVVSGIFRPTNSGATDAFPAPAPAAPYGSALSAFNGVSPNGTWSLYVVDDTGTDVGKIAGGWSLNITTADPFCAFQACTLGVPADITQNNDPGSCGAFVNYTSPTVTGSCGVVTSAPPSGSFFPNGTTPVVVTGTRQDNSTTTAGFNVTVNDVEGPGMGPVSASPDTLWAPNHKMRDVVLSYTAGSDNCGGAVSCQVVSVTSNESSNGLGDGDTAPDWAVISPTLVQLRAERSGLGSGRVYTLTVRCTDAAGNHAFRQTTVTVPFSQRN